MRKTLLVLAVVLGSVLGAAAARADDSSPLLDPPDGEDAVIRAMLKDPFPNSNEIAETRYRTYPVTVIGTDGKEQLGEMQCLLKKPPTKQEWGAGICTVAVGGTVLATCINLTSICAEGGALAFPAFCGGLVTGCAIAELGVAGIVSAGLCTPDVTSPPWKSEGPQFSPNLTGAVDVYPAWSPREIFNGDRLLGPPSGDPAPAPVSPPAPDDDGGGEGGASEGAGDVGGCGEAGGGGV